MSMIVTIGGKIIETGITTLRDNDSLNGEVVTNMVSGYLPEIGDQELLIGEYDGLTEVTEPSFWDFPSFDFLSPISKSILESIEGGVKTFILAIIDGINSISVEIITLSIITTAFGMIVAPLINGKSGVWVGRCLLVTLVGSIWRLAI